MSSMARLSMRVSTGESGIRVLPEMFKHRLLQLSEETVDSLQKIWNEAGYDESECQRLLGDLLNKLKITCSNELAAEQQILDHAKAQIDDNIDELTQLNEKLGRGTNVDYIAKMNCTDKLTELEKVLNEVGAEVASRSKVLDAEMNQIANLCKELGESMPNENQFSGPPGTPHLSDVRLQLMRDHKKELEGLKIKRTEEIKSIAKECFSHMCDMMYVEEGFRTMPDSETYLTLDKQVAKFAKNSSDYTFGVHKRELAAITLRLKKLIEEKDRRRGELAKTGEEIAKLWTLLRIPSVEREAFQNSFKKNLSMETLNRGYEEVARLREIRKKSLGKVITSIRNDILTLWEEAGIQDEDSRRREFPSFFDDLDTLEDSAVDLHEAYFVALRARVEELKPILLKISRREIIINERIELEHLQMNPERLTARGPNAREERKREEAMTNRVKTLEKLTKEIVNQITTWEETNGPFLYAGERYFERITRQEEQYIEIRDTLRNARKRKDGKAEIASTLSMTKSATTKKTSMLSTSHGVPATPSTSGKTRTLATPAHHAAPPAPTPQAVVPPPAPVAQYHEPENQPPANSGRDSEGTMYTSMTEIKDRSSNGSATVVRETIQ